MRFDLYSGPFTPDDQLKVSPFADAFLYIPDIKLSVVADTVKALNNAGSNQRRLDLGTSDDQYYNIVDGYGKGDVDEIFKNWLKKMDSLTGIEKRAMKNLTLGYVTQDVRRFRFDFVRPSDADYTKTNSPAQVSATMFSTHPFRSSIHQVSLHLTLRLPRISLPTR